MSQRTALAKFYLNGVGFKETEQKHLKHTAKQFYLNGEGFKADFKRQAGEHRSVLSERSGI
ncbi:hypothetical protein GS458_1875 [Geobacillus stearothermophilus]|nr:hypothetical protein GS458_1875 [Geobacillus stearothermophilus]